MSKKNLLLLPVISALWFSTETVAKSEQPNPAVTEASFANCLSEFAQKAENIGVSEQTIKSALLGSELQNKVIEYDRNQPEFVRTFADYIGKRVTPWRINKGRELLQKHQTLLQKLHEKYGIPPQYLVAFWGLETNFGQYKGKMPIIDSLATLACDQRRSAFFTKELMLALQLIDRENIKTEEMLGSWAGAMGHTQFMPSAYMQYAIDGDNDGSANLWNSIPDALTSAANFLQGLGWKPGYRWGREIFLPEDFDYGLMGRSVRKSLREWQKLGVTQRDGSRVPALDLQASILLPMGHKGPAFLVYDNFSVIMKWNFSEFYAISVGYLADRLTGASPLKQPLPDFPNYTVKEIQALQTQLNNLGFDTGTPDGILGPATRKGIQGFQIKHQLIADGFPTPELLSRINSQNQQLLDKQQNSGKDI